MYQIYYKNDSPRTTMFDIEFYMCLNDKAKSEEDKWYLELHSNSFLSGSIDFILDKCNEEHLDFDKYFSEFKKDCFELEELRYWLWERKDNSRGSWETVSKRKALYTQELENKIDTFIKKYGLYVNVD